MKKAAVISSRGLGDGLMMMVASHLLLNQGYEVTTFHQKLGELKSWFPHHLFEKLPPLEECHLVFSSFDLIVIQYDHHRMEVQLLIKLYQQGKLRNISVFYPSKESAKRETLTMWDQVFDEKLSMVDNIAKGISSLFHMNEHSKNNGLTVPPFLKRQKFPKRILIHPTRSTNDYVWPAKKFLQLAKKLKRLGYQVVFCVSPKEHAAWSYVQEKGFELPLFSNLHDLAAYIYESAVLIGNDSGPSHLASNLQIPTIIISNCKKRMQLWRPGWLQGKVLTPPSWIPNPKGYRLREKHWHSFISPRKIQQALHATEKR